MHPFRANCMAHVCLLGHSYNQYPDFRARLEHAHDDTFVWPRGFPLAFISDHREWLPGCQPPYCRLFFHYFVM